MPEVATLSQLDAVLSSLYKHRTEKHFKFVDIAELLQKEASFVNFGDIISILAKLHKDGYIEYDDRAVKIEDISKNNRVYRLTFEGRYWIERGGYDAENRRTFVESIRLERLEKTQIQYQIWLIWLTAILAVGTTIAALYYGTELYWNHGWFHF
jgi:hypothetical protein